MRWFLVVLLLPSAAAGIAAVVPDLPGPGPGDEGFALRNDDDFPWPLAGWSVETRSGSWQLPERTLAPAETAWFTGNQTAWEGHDGPAASAWNGTLRLANDGGSLRLVAPTGTTEIWNWGPGGGGPAARSPGLVYTSQEPTPRLQRIGASDIPPYQGVADITAYSLPESGLQVLVDAIRGATERLWLHVYDLRHATLTRELVQRASEGIEVRVLVEGHPVGHGEAEQRERDAGLAALTEAGAQVWLAGNGRYAFHHLKVLLADDRVAIQTENWNPRGVPEDGRGNRGWGVVMHDPELAAWTANWMAADQAAWDALPWQGEAPAGMEPTVQVVAPVGRSGTPEAIGAGTVRVVVSPDHTADPETDPVLGLLASAETRIWGQQLTLAAREANRLGWDLPDRYLEALLDAAGRDVDVRLHVSTIDPIAEARLRAAGVDVVHLDLPWMARLHNKGWIVDDDVLLGSMNANHASRSANREVSVILEHPGAVAWYEQLFLRDARDHEAGRSRAGAWSPTPWLGVPMVVAVAAVWAGFTRR